MADPLKMWLVTDFGQAIKSHIDGGLKVFPLYGVRSDLSCNCGNRECGKNTGKHPYTPTAPHGFKNAVSDIELAAELFEYRIDLNVGVATGEESRIFVIDVDNKNNGQGDQSLSLIQEVLGPLPETMRLITGNGYHLIFDYPEGERLKSNSDSFGESYPGVDVRANGGYIVIYPSRHFSGRYYKADPACKNLADLPKVYLDFLKADHRKKDTTVVEDRQQRSGNDSEWSEEEIQRMLDTIVDAVDDYHDWIAVGMALHKEGCPMDMWDGWSARGTKYKGIGDINKRWRGFNKGGDRTIGTVVEMATVRGWRPLPKFTERFASDKAEDYCAPMVAKAIERMRIAQLPEMFRGAAGMIGTDAVEKIAADVFDSAFSPPIVNGVKQKTKKKDDEPEIYIPQFSFDPLQLPGGLGETVRWITQYAIYNQPELAMMNVLAFAGAVFGRRYASPMNTRTNIYMVGIARTGGGKDHSRQMINALALESGLSNYIGGNSIRSDTGMLRGLMNNASQILQLDEFGIFMQALSDRTAPFHVKCISKALMSLYSDSKGVYHHGDYADEKAKPIKIANPNLCIYGTTTEESYIPALKRSAIKSGELNRFIVIPSRHDSRAKKRIPLISSNQTLVDWWGQFAPNIKSSLGVLVNSATVVPRPILVEWGDCEQFKDKILEEQDETIIAQGHACELWSRLFENTLKIAMMFAIARNPETPVLIEEDFNYAYSIVRVSIDYMSTLAENSMAETPQEQSHNEVLEAIKKVGSDGISRRELLRKFRKFRKKEIDDLVSTMVDEEVVAVDRTTTGRGGNPIVKYFAITDTAA